MVLAVLLVAGLGLSWRRAHTQHARDVLSAGEARTVLIPGVLGPPAGTIDIDAENAMGGGSPSPPLPMGSSDMLRAAAEQAIRQRFPNVDLSTFKPGYIVYMENRTESPVPFVFVEWLGRDALAVEKGEKPALDRKKVRKLRVKMTVDGTVLDVVDTSAWLYRNVGRDG